MYRINIADKEMVQIKNYTDVISFSLAVKTLHI